MPLKHTTETRLVFLLGMAIVFAGAIGSLLPSRSVLLWTAVLLLGIAYPILLLPLLRSRRADYSFRALHLLPAGILTVDFALLLLARYQERLTAFYEAFSWGLSFAASTLGLLLLGVFCHSVLRQWKKRALILTLLFIPFSVLALASEKLVVPGSLLVDNASNPVVIGLTDDGRNIAHSEDNSEDRWRMKMRRMERRKGRIAANPEMPSDLEPRTPEQDLLITTEVGLQTSGQASSLLPPPKLPSSGSAIELLLPLLLAGYCTVVHGRAMKRS